MKNVKKLIQTAIGIYMIAVLLSLALCERVNDLESQEGTKEYHQALAIQLF